MATRVIHRLAWLGFALSFALSPCPGETPPDDKKGVKEPDIAPPTVKELADKRIQFMKAALARYSLQVGGRKEAARVADPCLRWTNPIGGAPDGVVAVYAHKGGRPEALASF